MRVGLLKKTALEVGYQIFEAMEQKLIFRITSVKLIITFG